MNLRTRLGGTVFGALLSIACHGEKTEDTATSVQGALHARNQLQPMQPTLCWVQDSASTLTNGAFLSATHALDNVIERWQANSGLDIDFLGRCPADSTSAPTNSNYPGNIRIFYNEFDREDEYDVPGRGCSRDNHNGNYAWYPSQEDKRCQWNASVAGFGSGNILHEAGHALGMMHEHERSDNDSGCNTGHGIDDGNFLTNYDLRSVLHYNGCGTSRTDLSDGDKLGIEIAYPASAQVALSLNGFRYGAGGYVVPLFSSIKPTWLVRGASSAVFSELEWSDTSGVVSDNLVLNVGDVFAEGESVALTLSFLDPWEREKTAEASVVASSSLYAAILTSFL